MGAREMSSPNFQSGDKMSEDTMIETINELAIELRDMAKRVSARDAILLRTAAIVLLTQRKIITDVQQILGE